jgi:hypothetical protein
MGFNSAFKGLNIENTTGMPHLKSFLTPLTVHRSNVDFAEKE